MRNYRGNIIFTIAIVVGLLHHIIGPASSSTLGSSNPRPQRRRSVLPTGRRPTKERRRRRVRRRQLQSEEEGIDACTGSSIATGEYRVRNSHLCFTDNDNDEISTFGINSNGELVYTVKWVNSNVNLCVCACMCVFFEMPWRWHTRERESDEMRGSEFVLSCPSIFYFLRLFDLWNKIISCYAKCARTCWHTKVYDGWLVVPAVLLLLL